jgi:hypothetical protein
VASAATCPADSSVARERGADVKAFTIYVRWNVDAHSTTPLFREFGVLAAVMRLTRRVDWYGRRPDPVIAAAEAELDRHLGT